MDSILHRNWGIFSNDRDRIRQRFPVSSLYKVGFSLSLPDKLVITGFFFVLFLDFRAEEEKCVYKSMDLRTPINCRISQAVYIL